MNHYIHPMSDHFRPRKNPQINEDKKQVKDSCSTRNRIGWNNLSWIGPITFGFWVICSTQGWMGGRIKHCTPKLI